jgi:hypothetical protein
MIYILHIRQIAPGKMAEYRELETKEMEPLFKKLGYKVLGHFSSLFGGNSNETVALHAWDSLAQFEKARAAALKDPEYQKMGAKLNAMTVNNISRIMTPSEWSAMK